MTMCPRLFVDAIGKIMKCEIIWNSLSLDEWNERFQKLERSNFLQSYVYALGASRFYRQKVRWGLVLIDGKEAALLQLFEASFLFNVVHGVILDRGPLWFKGYGSAPHLQSFISEFQKLFPKRLGRKHRMLLEVEDGHAAQALIKQTGWKNNPNRSPYETYWLNLDQELDALRKNLDGKWRNALVKAEKQNVQIEWDDKGAYLPWLIKHYTLDKERRGYGGISPQFLDILAPFLIDHKNIVIGRVTADGEIMASVLFVLHGQSATYQIGVTTDEGRTVNAHHLLLWQGVNVLKDKGIKSFDLGGINDEDASSIKRFKKGLGGKPYRLVGHYY